MFACWHMSFQVKTRDQNDWSVTNQIEYTGFRQDSYLNYICRLYCFCKGLVLSANIFWVEFARICIRQLFVINYYCTNAYLLNTCHIRLNFDWMIRVKFHLHIFILLDLLHLFDIYRWLLWICRVCVTCVERMLCEVIIAIIFYWSFLIKIILICLSFIKFVNFFRSEIIVL